VDKENPSVVENVFLRLRKRMHLKTDLYVTLVPGLYLAHCEKREERGGEETAGKK